MFNRVPYPRVYQIHLNTSNLRYKLSHSHDSFVMVSIENDTAKSRRRSNTSPNSNATLSTEKQTSSEKILEYKKQKNEK